MPVGRGIDPAGEVLDAYERHALAVHHELARVRRPDTDHEHDVDLLIDFEQVLGSRDRLFGQMHDVHFVEQRAQVLPVGGERGANHFIGVRRIGIEDIVAPVSGENRRVLLEVAMVCRLRSVGSKSVARNSGTRLMSTGHDKEALIQDGRTEGRRRNNGAGTKAGIRIIGLVRFFRRQSVVPSSVFCVPNTRGECDAHRR